MAAPVGPENKPTLLRERDVKRIAEATRWAERTERNRIESPDTMKIRAKEDLSLVANLSGQVIPQYGLIWLVELESDLVAFGAQKIEYPGVSMLGIASGAIPIDAPGYVWRWGIHPVLCSDYATIVWRSRLSSQAGSFYARAAIMGLLLHIGDVAAVDQPSGLPSGVGLVQVRMQQTQRGLS